MHRQNVDPRIRKAFWTLKDLKDRGAGITNAHIHYYVKHLEDGEGKFTKEARRLIQEAETALQAKPEEEDDEETASS